MEIITISEEKIKIMLNADDLKSFDLNASSIDYSNTETKRMFWDILSRAKRTVGFDTDGHRVLVQLYPSRCGGCEMFVTRLSELNKSCDESDGDFPQIEPVINRLPQKKKIRCESTEQKSGVFAFEDMESLLSVCRRLSNIGYNGESEAYFGDDKRSYLFLSDLEPCVYLPLDEFSFITEYGTEENEEATRSFVSEHASEICARHAVEVLSRL